MLEQGPEVSSLLVNAQVACRPLGASVFDELSMDLSAFDGNQP